MGLPNPVPGSGAKVSGQGRASRQDTLKADLHPGYQNKACGRGRQANSDTVESIPNWCRKLTRLRTHDTN